jgi:4-hydroxybenzoate polyprenyltransferase
MDFRARATFFSRFVSLYLTSVYVADMSMASDITSDHWLLRILPTGLRPFGQLARLDRPIGTWLLLLPCWWSLALATRAGDEVLLDTQLLWLFVLFGLGAVVMRGAGCTVNDILDRHFDKQVARTANRPLPSGAVSLRAALIFLFMQLLIGLLILLQLPIICWLLGVVILAVVFTYPLMKRITYWPQFFLGLAFNWGAVMGWAAVSESLAAPAIALYIGGIAWTLGYDTIYAHQDKDDDALIGLKSTALKFGRATPYWLAGFYSLAMFGFAMAVALAGFMSEIMAVLLLLAAAYLAWQVWRLDLDDPSDCLAKFQANRNVGGLILIAFAFG